MSVTLHTSLGDVKFELFCDTAPRTCFNFLALAASGYYDGADFSRNIVGFMIQGGSSSGKNDKSVWGGGFDHEFHPSNQHDKRGMLGMAASGKDQKNKSQFFILYERQPHLNNVYTVFGKMLDGWDVLDQMERLPVVGGTKKKTMYRPKEPPIIHKVTIHANPLADEGIVYPTATGPPEKQGY